MQIQKHRDYSTNSQSTSLNVANELSHPHHNIMYGYIVITIIRRKYRNDAMQDLQKFSMLDYIAYLWIHDTYAEMQDKPCAQ